MPTVDRRRFLQLAGGSAALSLLTPSIARAASIAPLGRTGSLQDVEHVVILMQENRSFDHYFGTLRGVRGFGDPHPATLPSGKPVWYQSDGTNDILPFRPDVNDLGLAFIRDLDHSWDGQHAAFDNGNADGWIPAKTSTTMAHLARQDVPFHYALADAFTICDGYHCSTLSSTDPNRYFMWTGWDGNDGKGGGPVIDNAELGYSWMTYPERLQAAGIDWKIYQDIGIGLNAAGVWGWTNDAYIGNYGDNSLLYFDQYRTAQPGSPLYQRARTGTNASKGQSFFAELESDVRNGRLPQVSWIVAPEAFTEHPNWPANYGAWYVARMLDALTSDPDVWAKTALFLTYDENDGFFDHVVPPHPNGGQIPGASSAPLTYEYYTGTDGTPGCYGLGQRVPMLVISPWSTGGWVCSETFDHTSIIRFLEQRFGVQEPQITPWRRTVCGDLTSAFDFSRSRTSAPSLPDTSGYRPPDDLRHPDYVPVPPADPALPQQEPGTRPSRPLGYDLDVHASVRTTGVALKIVNRGRLGAQVQVRTLTPSVGGPYSYTIGSGTAQHPDYPTAGPYAFELHGPNGFFRRFAGTTTNATIEASLDRRGGVPSLVLVNNGRRPVQIQVADAYVAGRQRTVVVEPHRPARVTLRSPGGWYDVTATAVGSSGFVRTFAGRLDNGRPTISDPQLGGG